MKPLPNPENPRTEFLNDLKAAEQGDPRAIAVVRKLIADIADDGEDGDVVYLGHVLAEHWRLDDQQQAEMN